jgi:transposase
MKMNKIVKALLGYEKMKVLDFYVEEEPYHGETVFVASVELYKSEQYRCPVCGQKCGAFGYQRNRVKRWRSLDLGKNRFYVECEAPRCKCPEHGVKAVKIPWAFPDSDYTYAFEMQVAWCAANEPTNLVARKYRIKWHTVGNCVGRVQRNVPPLRPQNFKNLKRIAIDETSYQKGYKYITTVMNLDSGEIVWAHDGYGDEVLKLFFVQLTPEERAGIAYVAADGARWITRQVEAFCPNAVRCVDPFHVVGWATEALDNTRKRIAADTKKNGLPC